MGAGALTLASVCRMTLQSIQQFLAGIDSNYAGLASKLYPEYQSIRELAAADHASLQTLGIRAGIVGVIIQAAKGASLATPMQRLHGYQHNRVVVSWAYYSHQVCQHAHRPTKADVFSHNGCLGASMLT